MDTCPPEIHAYIFAFACTDGGFTGCSLALVSRYIRQVSSSFRWHSLSISGHKQARRFVEAFNLTGPHPVSHLFLSTRCSCSTSDTWWEDQEVFFRWIELQDLILSCAAPTLMTLTFASFDSPYFGAQCLYRLLAIAFAKLTKLSIRVHSMPNRIAAVLVDDGYGLPSDRAQSGSSLQILRPQLRHLHLACLFNEECNAEHSKRVIQTISSDVSHLRLSALEQGNVQLAHVTIARCIDPGLVDSVFEARPFAGLRVDPDGRVWTNILPHPLEQLIIQLPTSRLFRREICAKREFLLQQRLVALAKQTTDRFVYIPKECYGYQDAKADWLHRIEGKSACWEWEKCNLARKDEACMHAEPAHRRESFFVTKLSKARSMLKRAGVVIAMR